uniref:Uncharacterized protein n=1 Tax=Mola mola TaxID=94237 RepID=A0A3Q3W269_MOLML
MDIIEEFGNTSNVTNNKYVFNWMMKRIKYLAINITKNLEDLYIKKFGELINQVKEDLKIWSTI